MLHKLISLQVSSACSPRGGPAGTRDIIEKPQERSFHNQGGQAAVANIGAAR